MTVGQLCTRDVYTADKDETWRDAAQRMAEKNVGTLVILDANKRPIGIVTDRDLVVRGVPHGGDVGSLRVSDLMTAHPKVADEDMPIEDALAIMRALPTRRLLVVDRSGRLVGIVTIDDMLELIANEIGKIGGLLGRQGQPRPRHAADRLPRT